MNGSRSSVDALLTTLKAGVDGNMSAEMAVCPPFVFLDHVGKLLAGSPIALGAQNVCDQDSGAFTGEISGAMLTEMGCSYV
ncbi:MAG TPA: triose-phosphate isomerase, partial [Gammaproteobacteria bacterium]